jgi:hypothetical protein
MAKIILYIKNLVIATARIPKATFKVYQYSPEDSYFKNWWVTIDCWLNTLAGGDPDETISSRSAKAAAYETQAQAWGWGCRMCSFLAIFQENHCGKALQRNVGSKAVVPDEKP